MISQPVFQVDRDYAGSVSYSVTNKQIADNKAILTIGSHSLVSGTQIEVLGIDDTFNGVWEIVDVTGTTIQYAIVSSPVSSTACTGTVLAPSRAYIRYNTNDTVLDTFASKTNFHAEAWDYNTVRIFWSVEDTSYSKVQQDIKAGLTPLIAITRSTFGHPITPLDGQKIFQEKYTTVVKSPINPNPAPFFQTQTESKDNAFSRPVDTTQSLYDRNLPQGTWYYYSMFFYLKGNNDAQKWVFAGKASALTPYNYEHARKYYELIPPYYRLKDEEYDISRSSGTLQKLMKTIGFEADYTRTLAEGVENIYNIDKSYSGFVELLGENNFGITKEDGLGDIRYRSLVSAINPLHEKRGSLRGVRDLVVAASKYKTKILEGVNILNLTDDAEFVFDTGSWADITAYGPSVYSGETFSSTTLDAVGDLDNSNPSERKRAMEVIGSGKSIIACGLGTGNIKNRIHVDEAISFYPHLNGVRCDTDSIYKFSFYMKRIDGTGRTIHAGILWFSSPVDQTFNWSTDFIEASHTTYTSTSDTTVISRFSHQDNAPVSKQAEQHVYAVPYIYVSDAATHHVYGCMFNKELNTAQDFPVVQRDFTLTLGTSETLGSDYLLGDQ